MPKMYQEVKLREGLATLFPDEERKEVDRYSNSGAFQPELLVLDAVNSIPTPRGYASYFGQVLEFGQIPDEEYVQEVIALRTPLGIMLFVAMCPGGLYIACAGSRSPVEGVEVSPLPAIPHLVYQLELWFADGFGWTKIAACTNPSPNPWRWWTRAVVKNKVYFYQQGLGAIIEIADKTPKTLVINWYNPTSIIGTYNVMRWKINFHVHSGCTTTQQAMDFGVLGDYQVNWLHKAHFAAMCPELWEKELANGIGLVFSADVD